MTRLAVAIVAILVPLAAIVGNTVTQCQTDQERVCTDYRGGPPVTFVGDVVVWW